MVSGGERERDWNTRAAVDFNAAVASGSLVESKRREVEEASDLILGLKHVREVLSRRDWTSCTISTILP